MPIKRYQRGAHPYHSYRSRPIVSVKKRRVMPPLFFLFIVGIFISAVGGIGFQLARPLPAVPPTLTYQHQEVTQPHMQWPILSQAAVGSVEQGVLSEKPEQVSRPTASTAKLITALVVLRHAPLKKGAQGPILTMQQADVDRFHSYVAIGGSTAEVAVGERISQYQLLQGILLPSANNYADSLAIWAFGSLESYQKAAQTYMKEIGALHTTVGTDASGFSPTTTSTAGDLTRIGIAAMREPVIREILSEASVNLPVAGIKNNTNWLLGSEGVVGGKTGNTDEAGGVFVFASRYEVAPKHIITIVGAVQGEQTVQQAIAQARQLLIQSRPYFGLQVVATKGQVVATYASRWGQKTNAVIANDVTILGWKGMIMTPRISLESVEASARNGQAVGNFLVASRSYPVVLQQSLSEPNLEWRILRPI